MKFSLQKKASAFAAIRTCASSWLCVLYPALMLLFPPALPAQQNDTPTAMPTAPAAIDSPAVAADDDIRDIRGPVEIPSPPNYGLWIAILFGSLFVAMLVVFLLRRKRSTAPLSAAQKALSALDQIRAMIANQSSERFAVTVADIVREYIAARFGVAAPQRTTEEFLRQLNPSATPDLARHSGQLSSFLRYCDIAKFSGQNASVDSSLHEQLWQSARDFVDHTRNPKTTLEPTAAATPATAAVPVRP